MHTVKSLPQGYVQKDYVNLNARAANIAAFLLCAALLALGWFWRGFGALSALQRAGMTYYVLFVLALVAALLAFSWLHQLTHALVLRLLTGAAPLFARRGLRLFVGSGAYLCRRDAVAALLLPPAFWLAIGVAAGIFTEE